MAKAKKEPVNTGMVISAIGIAAELQNIVAGLEANGGECDDETLAALETGCDGVYVGAEGVSTHLDDFPQARRIAERGASRQLVFAPFDSLSDAQIDILVYLSRYCVVTVQTHPSPVHVDLMADRYEQRRVALESELGAFPARDLLLACSPPDPDSPDIDHPNLQAYTWDLNTEDDIVHPQAISRILQMSLSAEQRVLRRMMLLPGRSGSLLPLAIEASDASFAEVCAALVRVARQRSGDTDLP